MTAHARDETLSLALPECFNSRTNSHCENQPRLPTLYIRNEHARSTMSASEQQRSLLGDGKPSNATIKTVGKGKRGHKKKPISQLFLLVIMVGLICLGTCNFVALKIMYKVCFLWCLSFTERLTYTIQIRHMGTLRSWLMELKRQTTSRSLLVRE